ncbi:MAG TPA: M48 family metallopeptidase [Pseudomonas sp.]|uniref:M48 family metallopeptidase n=1 Tax=Pseudomonas sp. TaxID=306 RepID=UPI002CE96CFD|nr:M48 family metallopeptidase [Pseudomonas sp.]HTO18778.1 M48 family metallopeptidase [Pseudomonas sp.]
MSHPAPRILGTYYAGSSRPTPASLLAEDGVVQVLDGEQPLVGPVSLDAVAISSRLGNTPRILRFADGGSFETADNAAVDRLLSGRGRRHGLVHRLESSLRYVLLGVLITVLFVWGGVRYGIPALAEGVAFALPESVSRQVGQGVLEVLDQQILFPSELAEAEQARLRERFAPLLQREGAPIHLEFRKAAEQIGANAFALPSGTVVFTDQLVTLAGHDEELLAVLAHEIGHVERRHGLRQALQGSALGLLVMTVTGDLSSVSSLVAAIPVLLTQLGYSRDFEHEADRFAAELLAEQDIDARRLGEILARLEQAARSCKPDESCTQDADGWSRYLSTHPPTEERRRVLGDF